MPEWLRDPGVVTYAPGALNRAAVSGKTFEGFKPRSAAPRVASSAWALPLRGVRRKYRASGLGH